MHPFRARVRRVYALRGYDHDSTSPTGTVERGRRLCSDYGSNTPRDPDSGFARFSEYYIILIGSPLALQWA